VELEALDRCQSFGGFVFLMPVKEIDMKPKSYLNQSVSPSFGCLTVIMLVIVVAWQLMPESKTEDREQAKEIQAENKCKKDLQCWGEKNNISADVYCAGEVEKLSPYAVQWTDGTFGHKFSRFKWLNQQKSTLSYVGDKIGFQNGHGAYVNYIYECDFDPNTNTPIAVRAHQGRLP